MTWCSIKRSAECTNLTYTNQGGRKKQTRIVTPPMSISHSDTPLSHSHNISHTAGLSAAQRCCDNDDYQSL